MELEIEMNGSECVYEFQFFFRERNIIITKNEVRIV